jgi:hypothetical protein
VVGRFSEIGFVMMKNRALKEMFGHKREELSGN